MRSSSATESWRTFRRSQSESDTPSAADASSRGSRPSTRASSHLAPTVSSRLDSSASAPAGSGSIASPAATNVPSASGRLARERHLQLPQHGPRLARDVQRVRSHVEEEARPLARPGASAELRRLLEHRDPPARAREVRRRRETRETPARHDHVAVPFHATSLTPITSEGAER